MGHHPPEGGVGNKPAKPGKEPAGQEAGRSAPIRVILADEQSLYRVGMRKILGNEDGIELVAQPETLGHALEAVVKFPADLLLLGASLVRDPAEAVSEVLKRAPKLKVVVLLDKAATQEETIECVRSGARGLVNRSIPPELLVRCVRKVAAGEPWLDKGSVNWLADACRAQLHAGSHSKLRLSEKEQTIVAMVTEGRRNKEIAQQLGTSEQVVKNYLRRIYDRFGVTDRLELALYCLQQGLLKHATKAEAKGGSPSNL